MKSKGSPGPRNWQPRARTAAHRLAESCCGFWCCRISSVTVRSPRDLHARIARMRPSSSTSWQFTRVTSFLCMGLLSVLWLSTTPPVCQSYVSYCNAREFKPWVTQWNKMVKDTKTVCFIITRNNHLLFLIVIDWYIVVADIGKFLFIGIVQFIFTNAQHFFIWPQYSTLLYLLKWH